MRQSILAITLLALSAPTIAADAPVVVKIPRLTMEAAQKMAQAAVVACRKQGIQMVSPYRSQWRPDDCTARYARGSSDA